MAQVSKITPTGTLYTAGSIDEVTNNPRSGVTKNISPYSQDFTQSTWIKQGMSITATNVIAPDGTPTATLLTVSTGYTPLWRETSGQPYGQIWTMSGYFKAGTATTVTLTLGKGTTLANNLQAVFNLSTATVGAITYNGTSANGSTQIQDVGNGWYRCAITGYIDSFTTLIRTDYVIPNSSTINVWGLQLELGTLTIYEQTGANAVPAPNFAARTDSGGNNYITNMYDEVTYNVTSGVKKNLFPYSQSLSNWSKSGAVTSIADNTALAPDGTLTASTVTSTSASNQYVYTLGVGITAGQTYTRSIYAKAGTQTTLIFEQYDTNGGSTIFNLSNGTVTSTLAGDTASIIDVGKGWYRCITTRTYSQSNAMTGTFYVGGSWGAGPGGTLYLWGAQWELGSQATIYVPTGANAIPAPTFAQRTEVSGNVYVKGIYDEVTGILPVTSGLTLNFDPSYAQSYPGTGTTMYDIGGNTATATWSSSTVGFVSNFRASPTEYLQFYGNGAVTTNYVQPATTSADSFTWNVWFRATQNSNGEIIIGNRIPYVTSSLDFCKLTTNAWEFYPTMLGALAPLGVWQNVTLVKNGTTLSYYRNASLITTNTTSASKVANPFYIGGDPTAGEISTAQVGQVQIYNRALTLAEISQVFNTFRIRYRI